MSDLITTIEAQFFETMRECNIFPARTLYLEMDGRTHRFAVENDKHGAKSGAYYIHADGYPNWGFMDYHIHSEMQKFKLDREGLSDNILEQVGIQTETREQRERREQVEYEQGRARAYDEYCRASNDLAALLNHEYIKLKKLVTLGRYVRVMLQPKPGDYARPGDLLIPTINPYTGKFQALQRISARPLSDGKHIKGFYPRTKMIGGMYPFNLQNPRRIIICEGYATASSIFHYIITKTRKNTDGHRQNYVQDSVMAAMSCHNMPAVSQAMKRLYPGAYVIAAIDNDLAGKNAGNKCLKMGLVDEILVPKKEGADWNDIITFQHKI